MRKEAEVSTQSKSKHEAIRNTKQVNDHRESKEWTKQVEKLDKTKCQNETKHAKSTITSQKTSEVETSKVQGPRLPKDASVNKDHQKSTGCSEVYQTMAPINNAIES